MAPHPDSAPSPRWRWLLVPFGLLLPFLMAPRIALGQDLPITPYNLLEGYHALLHAGALKQGTPLWWDQSVLGGIPAFALGSGSPLYPGSLALWISPNLVAAWSLTLLLHLGLTAALLVARCNRVGSPLPITLGVMALAAGSMDAFYTLHTLPVVLVLPWLAWGYASERAGPRPAALAIAHWGLIGGIAGLIGWTAWVLAALACIGTLLLEGRRVPLLGIPLGALSAGVQLIPMIRTDGGIDLRDLGPALLGALHLAALVPVLAAAAREYRPLRWWPVLLVPLAALYPWTPAVIAAAAIALAQLRLTPGTAWLPWTVPVLLLASGLAAPATVSLPYSGLKAMVGEVRRMLPAEASPSFAVLQPDHTTLRPAGVYGEPLQAGDFTWSAAWPLLMNLAPDPIAATSVALPWNLAWDDLLRMTHRNLGPPAQVRLGELLQAEYALQALGVSVASWAFPNYPFLDYLPIDPDHPAEAIPAPASEEQRLKELEAEILENLADPNRPVPERPKAFEQQPVGGRHYYRSRGSVPWAVVLYRPSKKLLVDPGAPAERLRLALEALQAETAYPELGPGRVRYVVVAGAADEPAPVVEDRGFTVGTTPQVHPIPHGLDIALAVQAEETPWLMVRLSQADGWSATVNGEEAPLATANGVYLTVPLHEGQRNALVLRYRVPGLTLGLGLTGGGLVAWVVLAITGIAQGGRLWGEAAPRAKPEF